MKKKRKILLCIWGALAVLLSDMMCASVAYRYCSFQWGARYEGWSAPANTAFLYAIPYLAGIVLCGIFAWALCRNRR